MARSVCIWTRLAPRHSARAFDNSHQQHTYLNHVDYENPGNISTPRAFTPHRVLQL